MKNIDIITMGCSKNLVDTERVMKMFAEAGYAVRHNPEVIDADQVVINTCGFIGDAKEESIDMIFSCIAAKQSGRVGQVNVMGCLSERYRKELPEQMPEVDRWYGKFDWTGLVDDIRRHDAANASTVQEARNVATSGRIVTTGRSNAYIKISEGCNRFCAFCAIPLITGRMHSRPMEEILDEVRQLSRDGIREFNIIAQDLSSYGLDLYGEHRLAQLVDAMADVEGVTWIRLHYAYPSDFPYDLLPVMARRRNVCKYLDIALQHSTDKMLTAMHRHITAAEQEELIARIRREVPGIFIRTTLMTGFPGEGKRDFEALKDFVRRMRFERMGAFAYSREEGTSAARLRSTVTAAQKEERLSELREIQEEIAMDVNRSFIGKTLMVVCDSYDGTFHCCRSEYDSPEVDPQTLVEGDKDMMTPGNFYRVKVYDADSQCLYAELI